MIASETSWSVLGARRNEGLSSTRAITPEGTRLYSMYFCARARLRTDWMLTPRATAFAVPVSERLWRSFIIVPIQYFQDSSLDSRSALTVCLFPPTRQSSFRAGPDMKSRWPLSKVTSVLAKSLAVHRKGMYIGFTAYQAPLKNCRSLSCLANAGDSRLIPSLVDPARRRVCPESA